MSDVTNPSVTQVGRIVNISDKPVIRSEAAPAYRVAEQAQEQTIDLDAMMREIRRRLRGLEQLEADNRVLRSQLSYAHCQVGAATRLLRLLIHPNSGFAGDDEMEKALAEYQARFGKL